MDAPYRAAAKYVGETAENYEKVRTAQGHWQIEQGIISDYVSKIPVGSQIADIPFGTGRFAPFYIERGLDVFGADISEDMIAIAREKVGDSGKFRIEVAPAEKLPLGDMSVDYLICHRFIKWLPDVVALDAVMREFSRITRKEMFIQCKLDISPPWTERLRLWLRRKRKKKKQRDDKVTTNKFNARDIQRAVKAAGFKVVSIKEHPEIGKGVSYWIVRRSR